MVKITKIAATEGGTYYIFYDDGSIYTIRKEELREEECQIEIRRVKKMFEKNFRLSKMDSMRL